MKKLLVILGIALITQGCTSHAPSISDYDPLDEFGPMLAAASEEGNIALLCGETDWPEAKPESLPVTGTDLWQRLRDGFNLNLDIDNARITAERNWLIRNPQYIERVTTRAQRYLYHIVERAEAKQVPLEMALLPIVESAFDPFAYSHGRASGPWQFIPSTGKAFGLDQDYWYDGRRDILASTDAALEYLSRLAKRFNGDWELALAAYNSGGGTVSKAIRRNQQQQRPTDYWNLQLPRETRAYVPKLIAISQIVRDPERYGITLQPIANAPYFAVIDTGGQLDLQLAADMSSTDVNEIYYLNAGYSRWSTPPSGPHRLLVPFARAAEFEQKLASLPAEQRLRWQHYTIAPGDTLGGIAKRFNTTVDALRQSNNLRGNTIVAGRSLLIPQPAANADAYRLSAENRLEAKQNQAPPGRSKNEYQVKNGDSLWSISRRYNVGIQELAKWNGMAPGDTLSAGRKLVIWSQPGIASVAAVSDRPEMVRRVNYSVRRGDSLHRIANRFNVSVSQIASWNKLNTSRYLRPGQQLTLFVDVRHAP
ncbi:MAG: LysM peptidoglycan-binding domain-containing protein [Alcanivoracaceae bacterium]|jgi:membrane-bound lytic murein transglycosylase D|nr:LysM peptidoglycan-binding domain-containing protein [Alcanivoracaceae bacterium]